MKISTIEYQGLIVNIARDEVQNVWTAYVNELIYDVEGPVEIDTIIFDHEPTQDEIDQYLCLELGL